MSSVARTEWARAETPDGKRIRCVRCGYWVWETVEPHDIGGRPCAIVLCTVCNKYLAVFLEEGREG